MKRSRDQEMERSKDEGRFLWVDGIETNGTIKA